jgi:hypothetical protein
MSTLKPMSADYLTGNPIETMHRWHLANNLEFMPGDSMSASWCHKLIAAEILRKSHTAPESQRNGIFRGITVHRHNPNLILYGDLHKAKSKVNHEKEKA